MKLSSKFHIAASIIGVIGIIGFLNGSKETHLYVMNLIVFCTATILEKLEDK